MEDKVNKEKAIDEIVKIIKDFKYKLQITKTKKWKTQNLATGKMQKELMEEWQ